MFILKQLIFALSLVQECHQVLARHQNVHFLQVERLVVDGGFWASPALQAILSESGLPQSEGRLQPGSSKSLPHHLLKLNHIRVSACCWPTVDAYISSEPPVFLELRVRYLLSCERVGEAMALARCCAWHPAAGQHLFFLQVYLTWLIKTSQHDSLHKEVGGLSDNERRHVSQTVLVKSRMVFPQVAGFSGKDAVHIVCSLECEEKDELLLVLSRAFLSQQLRRGDMHCLW